MTVLLEAPLRRFSCPSCGGTTAKRDPRVTTELHQCPAQGGLLVPLVEGDAAGSRHVVVEREDWVNGETGLRYRDGRPVMAVRTEHGDGSVDCAVFAPVATSEIHLGRR